MDGDLSDFRPEEVVCAENLLKTKVCFEFGFPCTKSRARPQRQKRGEKILEEKKERIFEALKLRQSQYMPIMKSLDFGHKRSL